MTSRASFLAIAAALALGTVGLGTGVALADIGKNPDRADNGATLCGHIADGRYCVGVRGGRARGSGPDGPIDVKLTPTANGHDVAGTWNGGRVHFVVGPNSVRGTAAKAPTSGRNATTCHFDASTRADGRGYGGVSRCLGEGWTRPVAFDDPRNRGISVEQQVILLIAHLLAPGGR
jgi:hypothetical protein